MVPDINSGASPILAPGVVPPPGFAASAASSQVSLNVFLNPTAVAQSKHAAISTAVSPAAMSTANISSGSPPPRLSLAAPGDAKASEESSRRGRSRDRRSRGRDDSRSRDRGRSDSRGRDGRRRDSRDRKESRSRSRDRGRGGR
jgi:hypothetical protein